MNPPDRTCDEELISGYLDGALTQQEAQRVRLYLESSSEGRALFEELRALRETAADTEFLTPPDDRWPELPRGPLSWFSRSLGWTMVVAWLVAVTLFTVWKVMTSDADPWIIFLELGLPGGILLLLVSVLVERVRDLKTDRYRGVQR